MNDDKCTLCWTYSLEVGRSVGRWSFHARLVFLFFSISSPLAVFFLAECFFLALSRPKCIDLYNTNILIY